MESVKVALITGANKGIGKEIARSMSQKGFHVLVGSRDFRKGQAVADEFKKSGLNVQAIAINVVDDKSVEMAAEQIQSQYGKLDVLVNNAGITLDLLKACEAKLSSVETVFQTNVFGVIRVTQALMPLLKKAPSARIVNMSSTLGSLTMQSDPNGKFSEAYALAYCASKTALNAVTVLFAKDLRKTKIKVNAACPGYCATDINEHTGTRTAEQGAIAPVRLAMLGDDGPSGGFFDEDGEIEW